MHNLVGQSGTKKEQKNLDPIYIINFSQNPFILKVFWRVLKVGFFQLKICTHYALTQTHYALTQTHYALTQSRYHLVTISLHPRY